MENLEFMHRLVSERILSPQKAELLNKIMNQDALAVLSYLIRACATRKEELCILWGDSIGLAFVDLSQTLVQSDLVRKLPKSVARRHKVIPLYQFGDVVTIASANPACQSVLDEVKKYLGLPVSPMFSPPEDIDRALQKYYGSDTPE